MSTSRERMDDNKIDEAVLPLLYLGVFERHPMMGARAWKSFEGEAMNRLHRKGLISDPVSKARSVMLTETGLRRAAAASVGCSRRMTEPSNTTALRVAGAISRRRGATAWTSRSVVAGGRPQDVACRGFLQARRAACRRRVARGEHSALDSVSAGGAVTALANNALTARRTSPRRAAPPR